MRRILCVPAIAAVILIGSSAPARAQTVAVGPYYATPSWDQTIACTTTANCPRFVVLANFNNQAVLDRETGLVWQRTPANSMSPLSAASANCIGNPIGSRLGWRLPTVSELGSLLQGSFVAVPAGVMLQTSLPPGNPFSIPVNMTAFWTATPSARDTSLGWAVSIDSGPGEFTGNGFAFGVWCVRSGAAAAGS